MKVSLHYVKNTLYMDPSLIPALHDVLAVARLRSAGAAARQQHKTPSAISQQIRRVETHFGIRLFEREGRGLKLSPAGESALASLTRLFDEADAAFGVLSSLAGTPTVTVRIAISDYLGNALLVPVLRHMNLARSPLRFEITTAHSPEALNRVSAGEADIAIVTTTAERPGLSSTLLFSQPFYWILSRTGGTDIAARLRTEPLLRLARGSVGRTVLDHLLESERIAPVSTVDVPSVSLLISYASAGVGLGIAPAVALFETDSRKLSLIRADTPPLPVRLVIRDRYQPVRAVADMLDCLLDEGRRASRTVGKLEKPFTTGGRKK